MKALGKRHSNGVWAAPHPKRIPRPGNALGPASIAREHEHQGPGQKCSAKTSARPSSRHPRSATESGGRRKHRKRCFTCTTLPGHQPSIASGRSAHAPSPQTVSVDRRQSHLLEDAQAPRRSGQPTARRSSNSTSSKFLQVSIAWTQRPIARLAMSPRYCMPSNLTRATAAYARSCASATEAPRAVIPNTRPPAVSNPSPLSRPFVPA